MPYVSAVANLLLALHEANAHMAEAKYRDIVADDICSSRANSPHVRFGYLAMSKKVGSSAGWAPVSRNEVTAAVNAVIAGKSSRDSSGLIEV
jgi:hypothetical protein